jgi:hypothetical protein
MRDGQARETQAGPRAGDFQQLVGFKEPPGEITGFVRLRSPSAEATRVIGFIEDLKLDHIRALLMQPVHYGSKPAGKHLGGGMPTISHLGVKQADDKIHVWIDLSQTLVDPYCILQDL